MNNKCTLCPNSCSVDRDIRRGICGELNTMRIAKYYLHPFEEPFISGSNGSGTIFFSGCALKCVFCQNYELSRSLTGKEITEVELANIFKELELQGAHNINLVNPAHFVYQIANAMQIYKPKIPVVYNTGSYEKLSTLYLIDPFIDIYLPDLKFYSPELSKRYLNKADYFDVASEAISYMAKKKPTCFTPSGKMTAGVIVRHLVMPLCVNDSKRILKWIANELPKNVYVSLMSQYTPFGEIENFPELSRSVTAREYNAVVDTAFELGLNNIFIQERNSSGERYIPSWDF